jgi:hypothetical protein
MCEEKPVVSEDGILSGGQGRTGEEISIEGDFLVFAFAIITLFIGVCFGWNTLVQK